MSAQWAGSVVSDACARGPLGCDTEQQPTYTFLAYQACIMLHEARAPAAVLPSSKSAGLRDAGPFSTRK
jgi:hypothetical protein